MSKEPLPLDLDVGVLTMCYMRNPKCENAIKSKISKGEFVGRTAIICGEGCSLQEKDCPFDK